MLGITRGVLGGGRYPCAPPRPPLEPEAGSNLLSSKTYIYIQIFIMVR